MGIWQGIRPKQNRSGGIGLHSAPAS